jgi:hypothetical protein
MNLPAPPTGITYVDVAMSHQHTVALRSDGAAVAVGDPSFGVLNIPALPTGLRYVDVDVNYLSTVLLRSDGNVIHLGDPAWNHVPALPAGLRYVDIACGYFFAATLRSDGQIVAWGSMPAVSIPALPPGVVYVEIAAGDDHMVARRSDGDVVVCGNNFQFGQGRMPPLQPGESCVQVDAEYNGSMMRVGPTTRYVSVAAGCAGTLPAARLIPRDTPRIGTTHQVTLFDLPQDLAVLAFGWSQQAPAPLAAIGMPGCFQHVAADAVFVLSGQGQQATMAFPVPDWPGLVGARFYNQAIVLDPGANTAGAVVSEAAEAVIGHR